MKHICSIIALFFGSSSFAYSAVTQTVGVGSSVSVSNRVATFDSIIDSSTDLSTYTENLLSITVPDNSYVGFAAFGGASVTQFHYGYGGNSSYVTISTTDGRRISGLEFLLGDGSGSPGTTNVIWQAWKAGSMVGSGTFSTAKGNVVGWNDPNGFDELRVGASQYSYTAFGQDQSIALDNLNVQLATLVSTSIPTLPEQGMIILSGLLALGAIFALRRQEQ